MAIALLVALGLLLPATTGVWAEPVSPLTVTLALKNPPADATYASGAPVALQVEVENTSGAPVLTTAGFSQTPFWRHLVFTNQAGGIVTNHTSAATVELQTNPSFCFSRAGVLIRRPPPGPGLPTPPATALPVVPIEVLASAPDPFSIHYDVDNAGQYYRLRPGRYTVNARIPLLTFRASGDAVFDDCDQIEGAVASLAALQPGDGFTVVSNDVSFTIASPNRLVFKTVKDDADCPNASQTPCKKVNLGKTIDVDFVVLDPKKVIVPNLTARVAFTKEGGGAATLTTNRASYDRKKKKYLFDLPTRGLTPGVWRIEVTVEEEGIVRSSHVLLKGAK